MEKGWILCKLDSTGAQGIVPGIGQKWVRGRRRYDAESGKKERNIKEKLRAKKSYSRRGSGK